MEPDFADEERVDALVEALGDGTIPALIDGIERRNLLEQSEAVRALRGLGTSAAARALVNLLPDLSPWVRRAAFAALESWLSEAAYLPEGGEDELQVLLTILTDRRYAAQSHRHAATALGKRARIEPTPDLRRALPHLEGRFVPKEYAEARRQIEVAAFAWADLPLSGAEYATLVERLADPDRDFRKWVIRSIVERGEAAVPTLIDAMEEPSTTVRLAAADALYAIPTPPAAPPPTLIADLRAADDLRCKRAVWRLGALGEPAVPALVRELAEAGPRDAPRLIMALGLTRSPLAGPALWRGVQRGDDLKTPYRHALETVLAARIAAPIPEEIPLLVAVVAVHRDVPDAAALAARALETLARRAPCPDLRHALEPLQGSLLRHVPPEFDAASKAIEAATAAWADLPLPAAAPLPEPEDLPLLSEEPAEDLTLLKALAQRGEARLWWRADALVARLGEEAVEALDDIMAMEVGDDPVFAAARCRTLMAIAETLPWLLTQEERVTSVRLATALLTVVVVERARHPLAVQGGIDRFQEAERKGLELYNATRWIEDLKSAPERAAIAEALEESRQAGKMAWIEASPEVRERFEEMLDALRRKDHRPSYWIRRLRSDDADVREDATARLVALGEEVVTALEWELGQRHPHSQFHVVEALATIGGKSAAWALHWAFPKVRVGLRQNLARALERVVAPLVDPPRREHFDLYFALVWNAKHAPEAADRAAGAIAALAKSAPFPELRLALEYLDGNFWNAPSPAFVEAHAVVDAATKAWADLPLPASAPAPDSEDLPLPSEGADG